MASTLGETNPLRYRGYVYDQEMSLYYINSRYYDSSVGRFITADVLISTGQGILGNNMFAYCRNNPVCRIDITGYVDEEADLKGEMKEALFPDPMGAAPGTGKPPVGTCTGSSGIPINSFDPNQAILDGEMSPSDWANGNGGVPQYAQDMLDYLRTHNYTPPKGVKGGKPYNNSDKKLPSNFSYRKYDIHSKVTGVPRGTERIVIGSDGTGYYTPDHYQTFYPMRVYLCE